MATKNELSPRSLQILIMFADGASMKPLSPIKNRNGEYICVPNINHTRALMNRKFLELRDFVEDDERYQAWVISESGKEHARLHGWTGLVYDQPQLAILVCPPMNPALVSYTGRIDAGAAHRAIAVARQLLIAGVWNGTDAIAIHNPYELENKLMRLEWEQKTAAELVAGVDYDIYTSIPKPVIDEPPMPDDVTEIIPVVWTPENDVSQVMDKLTENLLKLDIPKDTFADTLYEPVCDYCRHRKAAPGSEYCSICGHVIDEYMHADMMRSILKRIDAEDTAELNPDGVDETLYDQPQSNPFETGMEYNQPQLFNFKRGDVVEFKMAYGGVTWLKGVFYNIYPGDPRFACIRYQGIYEPARLAAIRVPVVQVAVIDIFEGKADFVVESADSVKVA